MAELAAAAVPASAPESRAQDYIACIAQYDKEYQKWQKRVDKLLKIYRAADEAVNNGGDVGRFNIFWSNVQTLVPATFSRVPKPDVSRRFRDNDPVARVAANILQRALEYEVENYPDYCATLGSDVQDRFQGGRGTAWVRYEPHFRAAASKPPEPVDGVQITEDVDVPGEELDYECSPVDYVNWKDFGHSVARTWEEVTRVWRVVYMNEDAVRERFGDKVAKRLPYDASPDRKEKYIASERNQARIYEIWDKEKKEAVWLSKSLTEIIESRPDPLELAEFWPCPKPLYATLTSDSLIPVPDYKFYESQALSLNVLADRIDGLIKALQIRGVYNAAEPTLQRLFTEGGNTDLLPVKNWAAFSEKMGLAGAIDIVDLAPIAAALKEAYLAFSQIKEQVYEITGISDIVRGESSPSETLGAQQIKQNFVGLRLRNMQGGVAKFAAELLQIKSQIICGKYSAETILKISAADQLSEADKPHIQEAMALLLGPERLADPAAKAGPNPTRTFRIEVESDSLVQMDETQDKQDRLEFLKATGEFFQQALPVVQASPQAAPVVVSLLKFGITAFKVGRSIEGELDNAIDQLKQAAAQPRPAKPDPEVMKIQAAQATEQARLQADQQEAAGKMQLEQFKLQMDAQAQQQQAQMTAQLEQFKATLAAQQSAHEMAFEKWKVEYSENMKFAIAELAAKTSVKTSAMSANASADPESANSLDSEGNAQPSPGLAALAEAINANQEKLVKQLSDSHAGLMDIMSKPRKRELTRGPDGRVAGMIETMQ